MAKRAFVKIHSNYCHSVECDDNYDKEYRICQLLL